MAVTNDKENLESLQIERTHEHDDEKKPAVAEDWTGAAKKTDPEEIRLVRKLDYRIMVSCRPCPRPNTSNADNDSSIALPLHHVFPQLCRQKRHRPGSPQRPGGGLGHDGGLSVQRLRLSVRPNPPAAPAVQAMTYAHRSLFVGYVLMQVPSNMLITRIKPGLYMSGWMLIWAVVSGGTTLSVLV
jgi:hypothetical protein